MNRNKKMSWFKCNCGQRVYKHRIKSHICVKCKYCFRGKNETKHFIATNKDLAIVKDFYWCCVIQAKKSNSGWINFKEVAL